MRQCVRLIVFALPLLALTACGSTPEEPPAVSLSGNEIGQALVGNTLVRRIGGVFFAWEYNGIHNADGTMIGRVVGPSSEERVPGTWEATGDDLYCRTWSNHWGEGRRGCFRVSRSGERMIFEHVSGTSGGAERYVYEWRAGRPEGF